MIELLREVLSRTTSNDSKEREEATLQLAFVLERCSPGRESESYYESLLPPEILAIRLTAEEEKELVTEIGRMVTSGNVTPRLVWVLSKSKSLTALESLLVLIGEDRLYNLDKDSIWEALLGIDVFLSPSQDAALHEQASNLATRHNLKQSLQQILQVCDDETRSVAQRIQARIS